jgi:NADPH-dependent curcumin reductase CurA
MSAVNRRILLVRRPQGMPVPDDFRIEPAPIPEPAEGQFLVRAHYLSVDPLQRVRMNETSTYGATIPLGTPVWGRMVGEVVDSRHTAHPVGSFVEGMLGWQEYALSDGSRAKAEYAPGVTPVDPTQAPISTALGILGMPGLTAYFGLLALGQPQPGETVVISAAAGTVGSLAGQIARIKGCRVIGIVGSAEKAEHIVRDLGFHAAIDYRIDYRIEPDITARLRVLAPDGVDVYMDNVGGAIRDAVMAHLRRGARIPLVGCISQMHEAQPMSRDPQVALMHARARMEGFIVYDWVDRAAEAHQAIAAWLREGKLAYRETIRDGLENTVPAFLSMMNGGNVGKALVRLIPP